MSGIAHLRRGANCVVYNIAVSCRKWTPVEQSSIPRHVLRIERRPIGNTTSRRRTSAPPLISPLHAHILQCWPPASLKACTRV